MNEGDSDIRVAVGQLAARLMNEADATLASIDACITAAADQRAQLLVLPECAYPAYLLGSVASYRSASHMDGEAFVAWLARRAAQTRLHIVSGFVEDTGTALHNSVVVLDDTGRELGRVRKRFLWNADTDWFAPGRQLDVIETVFGPMGVVICAEMRVPEILATLAARGARFVAMPTCWINSARDPGFYENPLADFLVAARAREFSLPILCADKSGIEMPGFGYVGQSRIVTTDGSQLAQAAATGEEVVTATIRLTRPPCVVVPPGCRERLLSETPPKRARDGTLRRLTVGVVPGALLDQRGEALFETLRRQGVGLVLAPGRDEAEADRLAASANAVGLYAVTFPDELGVRSVDGGARIGCVSGQGIGTFAAARVLALDGAEILMCFDIPDDLDLLRTRAVENRVFVLGASERSAVIIAPDGKVLAHTAPDAPTEQVVTIDPAQAACKQVAPRTDIFTERRVSLFRF